MGIRLQPKEIEVPPDEPFKYDLLDRKASVEALTAIIGTNEGPGVIAVNAGWGMGKTIFLKMILASDTNNAGRSSCEKRPVG